MKTSYCFMIIACATLGAFTLSAGEKTCHRCEAVREYNAEHHKNFEYYDDYAISEDNDKDDTDNPFLKKADAKAVGADNSKASTSVAERSPK